MARLMRAIAIAGVVAAVGVAWIATPTAGAVVWTLTPTTVIVTAGTAQTVSLTATNESLLNELGCVVLDVSGPFTITGASIRSTNADGPWVARVSGQSVVVAATGGGARLEVLEFVTFDVVVVPTAAGIYTWTATAYPDQNCADSPLLGIGSVAVTVTGAEATPTPTPNPTPSPTPSPTPTPLLTVPSILPTLEPLVPSLDLGSDPTPSASPTPAAARSASASPSSTDASPGQAPAPPAGGPPAPGGTAGGGDAPAPAVDAALAVGRADPSGPGAAQVSLGPLGVIDGLATWAVPGAVIGAPGLIVIVWVLIQAGVAAAWLPAVGRLRGSSGEVGQALS